MDPPIQVPAGEVENEKAKKKRKRENQLLTNIRKQMEFYFSAANLGKNRMTAQYLKQQGGVPVSVFLTYNKIRAMTTDADVIVRALKKSDVLVVSEDDLVKLQKPIEEKKNSEDCSIYVEQIPNEADHDWLSRVFSCFGKVDYVSIPQNPKTGKSKGFAFIEFADIETVGRVVESFTKAGNYLTCDKEPGNLASLRTYDDPSRNVFHTDGENKRRNWKDEKSIENKKRKRKLNETRDTKTGKEKDSSLRKPLVESKIDEDGVQTKDENLLEEARIGVPTKRIKIESKDETGSSEVMTHDSQPETEDASETDATEEKGDGQSNKEKKRKRRKKKSNKSKKDPANSCGLQILTMNDWRALRNKYLQAQKEQMSLLKKHLSQTKMNSENPIQKNTLKEQENPNATVSTLPEGFTPGILVRISVEEPVVDIKGFKSQVNSTSPHVKYVDVKEGATSIIIRLTSHEAAQEFCQSGSWGNLKILEGEDEKEYWEVIRRDRSETLARKSHKERGKQKLLKRAEKVLGQHMRFSEL